ncbi:MAG: hypothetical protein RSA15_05870 [Bacilli bacterium]
MQNNQLIVEKQETGKTTYLFNEIERLISEGFEIIILDSATEHGQKSLLRKVVATHNNSVVIDMRNKEQIVLGNININDFISNFMDNFPFNEVIKNKNKIICFDLSYFLEKGHDIFEETNDRQLYSYYRNLYNNLAQQITLTLILMEKYGIIKDRFIVMDEIEFPITNYDISELQSNINFLASVHPENAFGTFYESFDKFKFQIYNRRKD